MDRRGFLRALGAIAAAAVVAPAMATAAAPVNKYEEAIRLYDLTVAAKNDAKDCNEKFNDLLRYLHTNFTTEYTEKNAAAAREVLQSTDTAGWRQIPPTVIDAVYPIALARMALKFDALPLNPSKLSEFDNFHQRYGRLIIDCYRLA